MHLLSGPVDVEAQVSQSEAQVARKASERVSTTELQQRVSKLEADVAELRELLGK